MIYTPEGRNQHPKPLIEVSASFASCQPHIPLPDLPTNNKTNPSPLSKSNVLISPKKTFFLFLLLTSRRMEGTSSETCHFYFLRNALCQASDKCQPDVTFETDEQLSKVSPSPVEQTFILSSPEHTSHDQMIFPSPSLSPEKTRSSSPSPGQ